MNPATAMVGLQVVSGVAKGMAARAKGMDEAARLESEAKLAGTQALQRDTIARGDLDAFLSSIRAARAANGLSLTSPNAIAYEMEAILQGDRARRTQRADDSQRVVNLRTGAQSARRGARLSLLTGVVSAGVPLAEYGVNQGWGS